MKFERMPFENQRVELDGNEFVDCIFTNCTLVFAGTQRVVWMGNRNIDCTWKFEGSALLTVLFLKGLYGLGPNARDMVLSILNETTPNIVRRN